MEDDRDDVDLLQEALNSNHVDYEMQVINDGSDAVQFIQNGVSLPHIIVLDFNLPKVHGKEILKEIKSSRVFKHVPVIVLTTSSSKDDVDYAIRMGAHKFIIKPVNLNEMRQTVQAIVAACGVEANN